MTAIKHITDGTLSHKFQRLQNTLKGALSWLCQIVWFQKISPPPPQKVIGILRGRGSKKPKFLKESKKLYWNLQRDRGIQTNTPSVGRVWIFLEQKHFTGWFMFSEHVNWLKMVKHFCILHRSKLHMGKKVRAYINVVKWSNDDPDKQKVWNIMHSTIS